MPRLSLEQIKRIDRKALPPALARALEQLEGDTPPKPSKYRSRHYEDGEHILYDSSWEHEVAELLELERQAGKIERWSWAPRFVMQRDPLMPRTMITYRPDFVVWPIDRRPWYAIDAKGVRTQRFNLVVTMWRVRMPPHALYIWTRKGGKTQVA